MRGHNIAKKKSKEREAQLLSLNPSSESQQRKHIKMIGKNIGLDPLKYQFLQQAEKNSFTPAPPTMDNQDKTSSVSKLNDSILAHGVDAEDVR